MRQAGAAHSERLFGLLLRANIEFNSFFPKAWSTLLSLSQSDQRADWFDRMAKAAPAIINHLRELQLWFIEPDYIYELLRRLGNDMAAIESASAFTQLPREARTSEVEARFESLMVRRIREHPPRLHGTFSYVGDILSATEVHFSQLELALEEGRQVALDLKDRMEKQAGKRETPPTDWIGPR